ncbi:MAG: hypothetical protein CL678_05000 [Bdellovibrionaceae bacterium]|nr:hypothetical protein [Pseudobdellovibrionaceae bacterium]|tara:strand:- start:1760 stop:2776 length:1017 start_codon:yes stop_codon:yes gene_type:complete
MKLGWGEKLKTLKTKIASGGGKSISASKILENTTQAATKVGGAIQGGAWNAWGTGGTLVICSYLTAGVCGLIIEGFIPDPVASTRSSPLPNQVFQLSDYDPIYKRNLFNSDGKIPGEDKVITPIKKETPKPLNGPAVRTGLPLTLVGTLIFQNKNRSIATLSHGSDNKIYPVRIQDEVPGVLKITKIEPKKVTFINLSNQRNEFIDLPEDIEIKTTPIRRSAPKAAGIQKKTGNKFNVSRDRVNQALGNLGKVLTQARAIPNLENGQPAGYKLFQIVPGSIYDQIGLKNGDIIEGVDGEEINDPGKAFEMLKQFKEKSHIELTIKRNGMSQNFSYDIN